MYDELIAALRGPYDSRTDIQLMKQAADIIEQLQEDNIPPHGDLIDRDALSKSLDELCNRICQYSKAQRKVMCSSCPLGDAFAVVEDDAPTIIPASFENLPKNARYSQDNPAEEGET